MPRAQLRISGLLQAAAIALLLAWRLGDTAPGAATASWAWLLAAYALLAAVAPWLAGGIGRDELSLPRALVQAAAFGVPMAVAAVRLADSAYPGLAVGAGGLLAATLLHLLVAAAMALRTRLKRAWRGLSHPSDGTLVFDAAGFRRGPPDGFAAAWTDIARISGWRSDLWTPDELRVQIELAGGDIVVFGEESPGFPALMVELERRFPPVAGWFERIALPPDDGHRTHVLYVADDG